MPIKNSKMNDFTSHLLNATAIIKLPYITIKNRKINDFTSHLIYATAIIKLPYIPIKRHIAK